MSPVVPVECLDHVEPVFGVDLQQRQHDEADRPSFASRSRFDARPQGFVDASERVVDGFGLHSFCHARQSCNSPVIARRSLAGDLDPRQVITGAASRVHAAEVIAR